ncbi:MAG: type II toxin-antitoxin system PemK/MazF family toxin [Acetobacteraceae bacterium]|nr:type II toxin-antitoxin system PemK/MazF family toxin [Acetobacteraceae bacterium]
MIEYSYLWVREASAGLEEGQKPRPCLVLAVEMRSGSLRVAVAPITTRPPVSDDGVEMPASTIERLGLRGAPCWILFTELNEFAWPGPDLRAASGQGREPFWRYGAAPARLHACVRDEVLRRYQAGSASVVQRTD